MVTGLIIGFLGGLLTYHFVKRNNRDLEKKVDDITDEVEDKLDGQ